ncbi:heat shock protein HtpX [Thermodesulfobium acidiphilum]|uniref:Protease HtpX homolog n=1 Tax=Thermodesulfobium acidiphilum TaxID=1794699 RepID=A0A2R4W2U5_THEAF|nr:zinc metalloprotease HtpX [Thermodesulfobium acidiphilum]AWB11060.1 heat shock protein HtpX [Thermodesulfobium acidiphilum]PMP85036.1 MAG: protease HtpX [Thermodesulfobium narugense]
MGDQIKTFLLLGLLSVILISMGGLIGGKGGLLIAFLIALSMNFISYWFSDKIVLKMTGAREVSRDEAPILHDIVEELAYRANIPKPKVYITNDPSPNAFATGRDPEHSAVAVTSGILKILDARELKGVLGHEIGHIKHRDILISSLAAVLASTITFVADMARWAMFFGIDRERDDNNNPIALVGSILMLILAPIAAMLIQFAISRSREFLADEEGAKLSRDPDALADALEKLHRGVELIPSDVSPALSHMYIVNPLKGDFIANLFSTHPPFEERIRRLRNMRIY